MHIPTGSTGAYKSAWGTGFTYVEDQPDVKGIVTVHLEGGSTERLQVTLTSAAYTVPDSCTIEGARYPVRSASIEGRTYTPGSRFATLQQPCYIDLYTYPSTCKGRITYILGSTGNELRTDSFTLPTGRSFLLPQTYRFDDTQTYAAHVMYLNDFSESSEYFIPTSDFFTVAILADNTVPTAHKCKVDYVSATTTLATDTLLLPEGGAYAVPESYTYDGRTYPIDSVVTGAAVYHVGDSVKPTADCTLKVVLKPATVVCTLIQNNTDDNTSSSADTTVIRGETYKLPQAGTLKDIGGEKYFISNVTLDSITPSNADFRPYADFTVQMDVRKQKTLQGAVNYRLSGDNTHIFKTVSQNISEGDKISVSDTITFFITSYSVDSVRTTGCTNTGKSNIVPLAAGFTVDVYLTTIGDGNGDGAVTKSDAQQAVGSILSVAGAAPALTPTATVVATDSKVPSVAAPIVAIPSSTDLDKNGKVDTRDLVGIINLANGRVWNAWPGSSGSKAFMKLNAEESDTYVLPSLTISSGQTATLDIALTNPQKKCTAGMFDLVLPSTLTVTDCQLLTDCAGDHTMEWKVLPDSAVRVVFYSLNNTLLTGTSGPLLRLTVKAADQLTAGTDSMVMINAQITSPDASALEPADVIADVHTLVTEITRTTVTSSLAWNTSAGHLMLTAPSTTTDVTIVTPAGILVNQFTLEAGQNRTLSLRPGIYIVNKEKIEVK